MLDIIEFGKTMPPNAKNPTLAKPKMSPMLQKDMEEASRIEKAPQPEPLTLHPMEGQGLQDRPTPQPEP